MSEPSSFTAAAGLPGPPPRLNDRYRLLRWLGQGSMGAVYLARDETLHREVAVKFLLPQRLSEAGAERRFLREARAVAQLAHPNIMILYDVGREGDWSYLVLEYLPGRTLHDLLESQAGPLPLDQTWHVLRGLLEALAYAHAQGVVHRDIKPENIILTADNRIKVTDFGLVLARGSDRLTREDMILGTIAYLAPEVVDGQAVTPQADLYAAGVVLYEMLTGRLPFRGDNPAVLLSQILHQPLTSPREMNSTIPPAVDGFACRLLARDPAKRYPDAETTLKALPDRTQFLAIFPDRPERPGDTAAARAARADGPSPPERPGHLSQALLLYAAHEETMAAVEAERRRLAGLLQEQVLAGLNLLLAQTAAYEQSLSADPSVRMAVSVLAGLTRQVVQQVHDLGANLHPAALETLGLEAALEGLAAQLRRAHGVQVELGLVRLAQPLPAPLALTLYRVTQTSLGGAVKEAHATQVGIVLQQQADEVRLDITANGFFPQVKRDLDVLRRRVERLGGSFELRADPAAGLRLGVVFTSQAPVQLTPRELAVMQLLVEGLSNKEIARRLAISPRTVNFHLDNIYSKLGVNSRTEAAIYALRQGWGPTLFK